MRLNGADPCPPLCQGVRGSVGCPGPRQRRASVDDRACVVMEQSGSACGRCDQTTKGTRRMTWRQEAMKDVGTCDKPQGAGNRAVICGFLNGETHPSGYRTLNA